MKHYARFSGCRSYIGKISNINVKCVNVTGVQNIGQGHRVKVFVCVEVLQPSQPNGVMSSAVSLPNHTVTGQA